MLADQATVIEVVVRHGPGRFSEHLRPVRLGRPVLARPSLPRSIRASQIHSAARRRAAPNTGREPYRFRVQLDAEGFPGIPGRYGQTEWYCDGVNCAAQSGRFCALPGQFALAVHTDRARLFEKLWAIPGVKRYQTGETECVPCSRPKPWSGSPRVIKARRRRTLAPEEARRRGFKPTHSATSEP